MAMLTQPGRPGRLAPIERLPAPAYRPLVLASASPRRRALLATLGWPFEVVVGDVDESAAAAESGLALARRLAAAKAAAVAVARPDAVVLAADTVVSLDGRVYGKPSSSAEAHRMLWELRGRRHAVITGVCVLRAGGAPHVEAACTAVWMRPYTDAEIAAFVASGESFDKAGAYAIQDPTFRPVARIVGCFTNVVGLPLCITRTLLRAAGLPLAPTADCTHSHT
jgi:septum formation protein